MVVVLLIAVFAAVGFFFLSQDQQPSSLNKELSGKPIIAPQPNTSWPGEFWFVIAQEKGLFEEQGLEVQVYEHDLDYYSSLALITEDKVDVSNYPYFDLLLANAAGSELVAVATTDISTGIEGIVASSEVIDVSDLEGKKVGTGQNTFSDYFLEEALNIYDLESSDIEKVEVYGEDAVDALQSGDVDAVVTWEPTLSQVIQDIDGSNVIITTSDLRGINGGVIVFDKQFINERPGDVAAFVNAWHKASKFILENPDETYQIISNKTEMPIEDIRALVQQDTILGLNEAKTRMSVSAGYDSIYGVFITMIEYLESNDLSDGKLKATDVIDSTFIENLK